MSAADSSRPTRVLLVGPLPMEGAPIGGTAVSFAELVVRCRAAPALEVDVVDTSRAKEGLSGIGHAVADAAALVRVLARIAQRSRECDVVVFNASSRAMIGAGPLVWAVCRLRGKPLGVRLFGGSFADCYDEADFFTRSILEHTVLAAPLVLLQTKSLLRRFDRVRGARWMPTTRSLIERPREQLPRCRRFVFLAQLRPEKGLVEALDAIERAPSGCTLTVHGPPMPGTNLAILQGRPRVRYEGVVAPEDVQNVLEAHDALVLPTYHPGEGIPGVVVEALQCGLPVIASNWRSVPEIVEHEMSGLIVAPKSVDDLARAMTRIARDQVLFKRLRVGARARGAQFQAAPWQAQFERWLAQLAQRGALERGHDLVALVREPELIRTASDDERAPLPSVAHHFADEEIAS